MIVYDKEQKQIVIPNGLGNVNIVINQGGDCPECPELTEISITENGRYEGAYNVVNVDVPTEGGEGGNCNLISPIVFSKDAGNTIKAENVKIPTFVYEGNQYYNVDNFNLADIEEFKIHILFKPNNSGNEEPINIFGCEDTDWDNTTFGARIYQGQIDFRMSGQYVQYPYTKNTWYDVEMGYNATKRWVFVNRETLLESDHTSFDRPRQTLMIGAINSGGNAFRPFYGKIAATYIKSNANQMWLLPKEDGTMAVYWNNLINSRNSISGDNNARFENDNISGDGMKSITWLGNLEDKWVTPSMSDRDDNGYIVVSPSEGYNGLKRTVINPQTIYNEGVEAGRAEGGEGGSCNLGVLDWTLTSPNAEQKNASDDGYDGYEAVVVRPENIIAQEKENVINDFKNKMKEITITENGTYSIDDQIYIESLRYNGGYHTDTISTYDINRIEVTFKSDTSESINGGTYPFILGGSLWGLSELPENSERNQCARAIQYAYGRIVGYWEGKHTGAVPTMDGEWLTIILDENGITVKYPTYEDHSDYTYDNGKVNGGGDIFPFNIGGQGKREPRDEDGNFTSNLIENTQFRGLIKEIKINTNSMGEITYIPKNLGVWDRKVENTGEFLSALEPTEGEVTMNDKQEKKYPYGFKRVEVNVPYLNGSYDEGYTQGQADAAANARVLEVTKNGNYLSKFSDTIMPTLVTGVYADGTDFYNYAELTNQVYNTNITVTKDSVVELWYKGDNTKTNDGWNTIFGCAKTDDEDFYLGYMYSDNTNLRGWLGQKQVQFSWDDNVWHHIIMKNDGLWIDDVLLGSFNTTKTFAYNLGLNGTWDSLTRNANGCYGMIKIDDVVIIPTADGFKNVNTGEFLEVVQDGTYTFTENLPIYAEGELYKTINVNVIPKINLKKEGLRLGHSTFTEVPEWVDFEGITVMSNMFYSCKSLQTIPLIDTSIVIDMNNMFDGCSNLQTIPPLNTSNVTSMKNMFNDCSNLQTIPPLNTSKVSNMDNMFASCSSLVSLPALNAQSLNMYLFLGVFGFVDLPNLTDFGGFLNLKQSLIDDSNLKRLPNLTKESCINVLNGLYDFTGNGETPNDNQGKLKVHQNFLDKVGEEINISINKGWTITV